MGKEGQLYEMRLHMRLDEIQKVGVSRGFPPDPRDLGAGASKTTKLMLLRFRWHT